MDQSVVCKITDKQPEDTLSVFPTVRAALAGVGGGRAPGVPGAGSIGTFLDPATISSCQPDRRNTTLVSSCPAGCLQRRESIPHRVLGMPRGGYIWDEGAWLGWSDTRSCAPLSTASILPSCSLLHNAPMLRKKHHAKPSPGHGPPVSQNHAGKYRYVTGSC